MLSRKSQDKILTIIGHLGMLGILAMAYWLWVERSIVFDNSLYSYMMIWREGFYIPHDRRINFLWQWIPILGLKFGVSLPTFLKLVSIGPAIFLYIVFTIIVHFLNNRIAGLYLVLSLVILTRYKFYSAISEVYLSMAFVALMLCWMTLERSNVLWLSKKMYTILGAGILSLCYLGHPLIFYPLGVAILFDYSMQKKWLSWNHIFWLSTTSVLFMIKYISTQGSSYEGKVVEGFQQNSLSMDFLNATSELYTLDIFWRYVETQWAFPLIVCAAMLICLLVKRNFMAVTFLIVASIVWIIFVSHLNAYIDRPYLFMIEGYLGLWALIILLPLAYIKIENIKFVLFRNAIFFALILFGLHRISSVQSFYTQRMNDIRQKISMSDSSISRNLVFETNLDVWDKYWLIWSVPFESLILSTLEDDQKTSIILLDKNPKKLLFEEPYEIMLGTEKDSIKYLNPNFFSIDHRPFVKVK